MSPPPPLPLWIIRAVLLLIAAATALFVAHFWVNVPYGDEWDIVPPTWSALKSGTIDLQHLFAQHNEHRPAVVRLLYAALAALTNWDTRAAMVATQVLLVLCGLGCTVLARESIQQSGLRSVSAMTLAFLALFTPAQRENVLTGIGFAMYLPGVCLLIALWFAHGRVRAAWIVIGTTLLALVASFSLVTGLLCWFLMPWVWGARRETLRTVWPWALWVTAAAATFSVYFSDYVKPGYHPSVLAALRAPAATVDGLLLYLGSSFAGGEVTRVATARWCGLVLCALLVALGVWLFRNRRDRDLLNRSRPWIILGSYGLAAGLMVLIGRIGFNAPWMLTSRYIAFSSWVVVACIMLVWLWTEHGRPAAKRGRALCALALAGAFVVMSALAVPTVWNAAASYRIHFLRAKAAVVFADVSPEADWGNDWVHPDWAYVRGNLHEWERAGIVRDLLSEVTWHLTDTCEAGVITRSQSDRAGLSMQGWAYLQDQKRPADTVVVTETDQRTPRPILAMAPRTNHPTLGHRGWWQFRVPAVSSPDRVEVWAYDAERGRAYRLCAPQENPRRLILQ